MNLIFINGTMGAGKTTVSRALQKLMPPCVFADGDNFWDMNPFAVNGRSKEMVLSNIAASLAGFIESGLFENILFCWVMHEESIVKDLLSRIPAHKCRFFLFTLTCDEQALKARLSADIAAGRRSEGVTERSRERAAHYGGMLSYKIDTSRLSPEGAAGRIADTVRGKTALLPYIKTETLTQDCRRIREKVFVEEQDFEREFDGQDEHCFHLCFYKDGKPAACCRFFQTETAGVYALGRIAVLREYRSQGLGRYVLQAAEECARQSGAAALTLSAQVRARGFYEKCGFSAEGEVFPEEGVPHIRMAKKI